MIDFQVNKQTLDDWVKGVNKRFEKEFEYAGAEIKLRWWQELKRQQSTQGDGRWPDLQDIPDDIGYSYKRWKDKNYPGRAILTATGRMMDEYYEGIRTETTLHTVSAVMPFPSGRVGVRAMSHQDEIGQPIGVPPRPFDTEILEDIALEEFNAAMSRAVK